MIYLLRHGDAEDGDGEDAARRLTPRRELPGASGSPLDRQSVRV